MKDTLVFFKNVHKNLFKSKNKGWNKEHSLLTYMIEKIEWKKLNSSEKNEQRKAAFSMSQKWSNDPFVGTKRNINNYDNYLSALVTVCDLTIELNDKITLTTKELHFQRLKALLIIEQEYFDLEIIPNMHVPLDMFKLLISENDFSELKIPVHNYIKQYKEMWELWPKNPFKKNEIE